MITIFSPNYFHKKPDIFDYENPKISREMARQLVRNAKQARDYVHAVRILEDEQCDAVTFISRKKPIKHGVDFLLSIKSPHSTIVVRDYEVTSKYAKPFVQFNHLPYLKFLDPIPVMSSFHETFDVDNKNSSTWFEYAIINNSLRRKIGDHSSRKVSFRFNEMQGTSIHQGHLYRVRVGYEDIDGNIYS